MNVTREKNCSTRDSMLEGNVSGKHLPDTGPVRRSRQVDAGKSCDQERGSNLGLSEVADHKSSSNRPYREQRWRSDRHQNESRDNAAIVTINVRVGRWGLRQDSEHSPRSTVVDLHLNRIA